MNSEYADNFNEVLHNVLNELGVDINNQQKEMVDVLLIGMLIIELKNQNKELYRLNIHLGGVENELIDIIDELERIVIEFKEPKDK